MLTMFLVKSKFMNTLQATIDEFLLRSGYDQMLIKTRP